MAGVFMDYLGNNIKRAIGGFLLPEKTEQLSGQQKCSQTTQDMNKGVAQRQQGFVEKEISTFSSKSRECGEPPSTPVMRKSPKGLAFNQAGPKTENKAPAIKPPIRLAIKVPI